jgi:hypothetical protein
MPSLFKQICAVLCLVFGLCLVSVGRAQTVTGSGTSGNIAKFTGSSSIGNSVMIETNGNIGIGTPGPVSPLTVINFSDSLTPQGLQPYAIYGFLNNSTIDFSAAIRGDSLATTGGGIGVIGLTNSSDGTGVFGTMNASSGQGFGVNGTTFSDEGIGVLGNRVNSVASGFGGGGVRGLTSAANFVFTYGTAGVATANSGSAVGIFGQAFSPNGTAGLFANVAGGNIILGGVGQPEKTVFRVDGHGTIFADGGFRPFGADFAESVEVEGNAEHYAPGDLLVIDASGERRVSLSRTPYSTLVAGIYSSQPGVVASQHRADEALPKNEVPLAVVGIVPCKVTAENGPIAVGDLLVASSTPGHAMKGTDRAQMLGAVVGKALEPLGEKKGVIQVLVTLQ